MRKQTVMILCGGPGRESEISLLSASNVLSALPTDEYEAVPVRITGRGEWQSADSHGDPRPVPETLIPMRGKIVAASSGKAIYPDAVFPVIHGDMGEDGTLCGMLDCLGLPYVGCGCRASAVCYDKSVCKSVIRRADINTSDWCDVQIECPDDLEPQIAKIENALSYPLFIKPRCSGSSIGASPAKDRDGLRAALVCAARVSCFIMAEPLTVGRECEVAVFCDGGKPVVSRPGEIEYSSEFYDFDAKYSAASSSTHIPARIPEECAEQMRRYALTAFRALGCRHLCRFDFFVTDDRRVWFSEANTMPGMTDRSLFPALMEDSGITFTRLVCRLVSAVLL